MKHASLCSSIVQGGGSGAASFWAALYAFHAQHHLQRHGDVDRVCTGGRLLEPGRDVAPGRPIPAIRRQMLFDQRPHIGERLERS